MNNDDIQEYRLPNRILHYIELGDYEAAVTLLERDLGPDPNPVKLSLIEKYRRAAAKNLPRGQSAYARARRTLSVDQDSEVAYTLFDQAFQENDHADDSIKYCIGIRIRQERYEDALELLQIHQDLLARSGKFLATNLIHCYFKLADYESANKLIESLLVSARSASERVHYQRQLAVNLIHLHQFARGEQLFAALMEALPDDTAVQRNRAYCLFKLDRLDEAERLLEKLLEIKTDDNALELLEQIREQRIGGELLDQAAYNFVDTGYLPPLAEFLVKRVSCLYSETSSPNELWESAEMFSQQHQHFNAQYAEQRAVYYLCAAHQALEADDDYVDIIYRSTCRGLIHWADKLVLSGKPIEAACDLYSEALTVLESARNKSADLRDRQDAQKALGHFLLAYTGKFDEVQSNSGPIKLTDVFRIAFADTAKITIFLDAVTYLVTRSGFAHQYLLSTLYQNPQWRLAGTNYRGSEQIRFESDFYLLWPQRILQREYKENRERIAATIASIDDAWKSEDRQIKLLQVLDNLRALLFFSLDIDYCTRMVEIIHDYSAIIYKNDIDNFQREQKCRTVEEDCANLRQDVIDSPTRVGVEYLLPFLEAVEKQAYDERIELYIRFAPRIGLALVLETYTVGENGYVELLVRVTNQEDCLPARNARLLLSTNRDDSRLFSWDRPDSGVDAIWGGRSRVMSIQLHLTKDVLESTSLQISAYLAYDRELFQSGESDLAQFQITIKEAGIFQKLPNSYDSTHVPPRDMFVGRNKEIDDITRRVLERPDIHFVIYGQMRIGKSTVLTYLAEKLREDERFIVVNLNLAGAHLDLHAKQPFDYLFMYAILEALQEALVEHNRLFTAPLGVEFPSDLLTFCESIAPLATFDNTLKSIRRAMSLRPEWRDTHIVVMIDEFSALYREIIAGRLPDTFTLTWKSLLQQGYFSTIVTGHDVMPRFMERYPNDFSGMHKIRLSYLSEQDTRILVERPMYLVDGSNRILPDAVERIIELTAGHPYYVQFFCQKLVDFMNRHHLQYATFGTVENVKQSLITGRQALTAGDFHAMFNSGDSSRDAIKEADMRLVLTQIALNSRPHGCPSQAIQCLTQSPVADVLDDLVNREVIYSINNNYHITLALFQEWLVANQR